MKSVATKPEPPAAKKAQATSTGSQQPAQTIAEKPFNPLWHSVATRTEASGAAGEPTPPRTTPSAVAKPTVAKPSPRIQSLRDRRLLPQGADDREPALEEPEFEAVQFKLTVGAPNDPFEQEADRAAAAATSGGKVQLSSAMPSSVSRSAAPASEGGGGGQASISGRISSADGGRPLSDGLRGDMEHAFGTDFSNVRIHDTAVDRGDAEALGARAFTHKSGIWLGPGGSAEDRTLMAHELTHVVQQGASIRRKPAEGTEQSEPQAGEFTVSDTPDIQAHWYNFSIPGTNLQFDPSIDGIKTAAGMAKDTVVDTAVYLKDKAVDAFQWVFDKIKGLIDDGIDWLKGQFTKIEAFAKTAFDTIKDGLSSLLAMVTSPIDLLTSAFKLMNPDLLETGWNLLKSGATAVLNGIKTVINGVLGIASGFWDTVSGFVDGLFDTVEGIIDSWPFRQLPGALQRAAQALFDEIRGLWNKISTFLKDLIKRLKKYADNIIDSLTNFIARVVGYGIQAVIKAIRAIRDAWEFVSKVAADPIGFIKPHTDKLAAKLNAQAPPKAIALGNEKLGEKFTREVSADGKEVVIQRQPSDTKPTRSRAGFSEVGTGFVTAIKAAWAGLDIGKMLLDSVINMFWPPATIRAIGKEFSELWNTDWANAAGSLFAPRKPWDDFWGFWADIWSNILVLLDFPLALWRRLNSVLMLLMGYVTIILIIIFAIAGGVLGGVFGGGVGGIPGAIAGAGIGLEMSAAIGEALLVSYFLAEGISVVKAFVDLFTALQTQEEKNRDYIQIAGSLIGMAVAAIMVAIMWLFSSMLGALVKSIKGGGKPAVEPVKPAAKTAPAADPVKPVEPVKPPEPVPAEPVQPVEPATPKPAEPVKPAEPGQPGEPAKPGDPGKPAEPVKPAEPGKPTEPTPDKPAEPAKPAEPKPAEPKPAEPKPAEPAKPAEPKPVEPAKPEPAKPAEPTKPGTPEEPGQSPKDDTKPAKPKESEPVSEVEGKPNTYKVNDKSALKATKPSRIQGLKNEAIWHWKLYVELPNGKIAVFCEVNIRFRGSPDLNLHPQTAMVEGMPGSVFLERGNFQWTSESLELMIKSYTEKFGVAPENLGGWLAKKNLANFQNEFARIRRANPKMSSEDIGALAVREISFGKQRIPLGYDKFHVSIAKVGKVVLEDGTTETVPTMVRIEATQAPFKPEKVPFIPRPDVKNPENQDSEDE